jgi:Uma2 family endonuclease
MKDVLATSTLLITQEQYERRVFEHGAEFVDGRIIERPMPTAQHARMQGFLVRVLHMLLGLQALPELRLQTRTDRARVPDVCLIRTRSLTTHRLPLRHIFASKSCRRNIAWLKF